MAIELTRLATSYAPAFHHLGTVYALLVANGIGDHNADDAIDAYRMALRLEPEYGYAHVNLGFAYAGRREWSRSKHHLDKAIVLAINVPGDVIRMVNDNAHSD